MNKCLILGTKSYSFENDKNERIEGAKISYILENKSMKENENGYLPLQTTGKLEILGQIKEVPGVYDVEFGMVPGKNNKPQLEITGFKFIKSCDLSNLYK